MSESSEIRPSEVVDEMNQLRSSRISCPICQAELEHAEAVVDPGFMPPMLFWPYLKFRRQKGKKWIRFLTVWKKTQALHCQECGALVLAPSDKEHLQLVRRR